MNLDDAVDGQQPVAFHLLEGGLQGGGVAADFLGGGILDVVREQVGLVEFVMGGDDVLDLGAVLGLLQSKGVDQDVLVGDGGHHALEFGQITVGRGKAFQHRTGFQFGSGW